MLDLDQISSADGLSGRVNPVPFSRCVKATTGCFT
ncbi:MAG: hypothetical protein JWL67_1465 [Solirubrobacterales bacterium]|jgi:hypothetical protein|nr:hypothetical protein [Solirubrobacterales bacterium]